MCYPPELRAWFVGSESQELQLGNLRNYCDAYIHWESVRHAPKSDMERAQHICDQEESPFDSPEKRPTIMELNGTPVASCVIDGWQKPSVPNRRLIRTVQMELPWGQRAWSSSISAALLMIWTRVSPTGSQFWLRFVLVDAIHPSRDLNLERTPASLRLPPPPSHDRILSSDVTRARPQD